MDLSYEELRLRVHLEELGDGLCVTLCGGDRAHIGSVAIAEPRESLHGGGSRSATVSTYNCVGHKDGELADVIAWTLASRLGRRTVVVCGIHYDALSPELLEKVRQMAAQIARDIEAALRSGSD